ncbi:T9SS type A sorting domain-containing protein [Chryseobacterium sp. c4a]|uniref:T9SS type A sorting domain-containing protein n=1 Tax=Chryseobacterium sp. c4a TaxID=1573582 RepID=UPI001359E156|nr:T9SS type A sorting domain-containing protein [Chryseobacterium sp. c4a]
MKKTFLQQGIMHKALLFTLLFLTGILPYAQDKVYASSQTNQTTGVCLLCSIQNPQNAVGNNENDYAVLKIPIGVLATIKQTLIFPAPINNYFAKIIVGIGTANANLSIDKIKKVHVETFIGTVSNNDYQEIGSDMLKIGQDPKKGTIEFTPKKPFDRVRIYLSNGLLDVGDEFRIYYTYHIPSDYTTCSPPPFSPLVHIPFNGSLKNTPTSEANDFIPNNPSNITYRNNMACGNSFYSSVGEGLTVKDASGSIFQDRNSIAFWVLGDDNSPDQYFDLMSNYIEFRLTKDSIKVRPFVESNNPPSIVIPNSANQLNHYVITRNATNSTKEITTCLYKNGHKVSPCSSTYYSDYPPFTLYRSISIKGAQIDEYLLYRDALTEEQVLELYCSYSKSQGCSPSSSLAPATKLKITPEDEQLIISPNPTTGQITLGGNVLLLDADIAITNTSSKEVYHSKFSSKTFDLPATLPGGVYILTLKTKQGRSYSKKVLLTR